MIEEPAVVSAAWDRPEVPAWLRRRYWVREPREPGPRFIYKFRPLPSLDDTNAWDRLRHWIVDHEMWLATPSTFSDPMDSHMHFEFTQRGPELRKSLEQYMKRAARLHAPDVRAAIRRNPPNLSDLVANPKRIEKFFNATVENQKQRMGMCCYCMTVQHRSMWDSYADAHRGIALQFEPWRDPSRMIGFPVVYSDEPPIVQDWFKHRDGQRILRMLHRKSPEYSREKEYRIHNPTRGNYWKPYRAAALAGVVFGMRCEEERRKKILQLILEYESRTKLRLKLYQANMDVRTTQLRFSRLENSSAR